MSERDLEKVSEIRNLALKGKARQIRERSRLSLRDMAEVVGVNHSSLSRWETGESMPRPAAALRWARILRRLDGAS